MARIRTMSLLGTLSLVLAACGGSGLVAETSSSSSAEIESTVTRAPGTEPPAEPSQPVASALDDPNDDSFPDPLIDPRDVISGGPPPDGIPPIDDPEFTSVPAADQYLAPDDPIVYVDIGGDVKGYPVQILIWHEIVNDTVGGVPVSVTYCPLCNSAVAYDRRVAGEETTFGTSGRLYNSALVMYDRATESLWTHYDGRAVIGARTGAQLEPIPAPLLGWEDFKDQFPEAQILDRERTGHSRQYGANPYSGYDDVDATPFLFRGDPDERAALMQRVVGVAVGETSAAWSLDQLQVGQASATMGVVGDQEIVILWKSGQSTALESVEIDGGRDVGSVGVFVPIVEGRQLTFRSTDDGFEDVETGSRWSITGKAVAGQLEGAQLEAIPHLDTFWFAWSSYRPGTELVGGGTP